MTYQKSLKKTFARLARFTTRHRSHRELRSEQRRTKCLLMQRCWRRGPISIVSISLKRSMAACSRVPMRATHSRASFRSDAWQTVRSQALPWRQEIAHGTILRATLASRAKTWLCLNSQLVTQQPSMLEGIR